MYGVRTPSLPSPFPPLLLPPPLPLRDGCPSCRGRGSSVVSHVLTFVGDMAGEAGRQRGGCWGSVPGPMMGDTFSGVGYNSRRRVSASFARADPRRITLYRATNIVTFVQGGAQEPQSGLLVGESGRGRRRSAFPWRSSRFSPRIVFCSVLWSISSSRTWWRRRSSRFSARLGSNSVSGAEPRGAPRRKSAAGLVAPFLVLVREGVLGS